MTIRLAAETPWYELFSRGARDWLRHNQKVREAVKSNLPDMLAGEDLMTQSGNKTVMVPVKFLEHSRLRLADAESQQGAGQGRGQPGDVLQPGRQEGDQQGQQTGGNNNGEIRFMVELKVDEIVDWLWEEMKLPDLKPKRSATMVEPDYVREGWDKRGARSRLDRRRTLKEAVKRRYIQSSSQQNPVAIVNEDLRFRQLVRRSTPATNAAVIFALDVSGSMDEAQRRLAKTFFFFALQGIRRQYAKVETVFLAHAAEAWEFEESQFFQASSSGGTVSSGVFHLGLDVLKKRYDPQRYNVYFFYASDGENAAEDREAATASLGELAAQVNYAGYVETGGIATFRPRETQLAEIFADMKARSLPVGTSHLNSQEDIWRAIREFFTEQARQEAA
jgi:sporulation protein YhbH